MRNRFDLGSWVTLGIPLIFFHPHISSSTVGAYVPSRNFRHRKGSTEICGVRGFDRAGAVRLWGRLTPSLGQEKESEKEELSDLYQDRGLAETVPRSAHRQACADQDDYSTKGRGQTSGTLHFDVGHRIVAGAFSGASLSSADVS